MKALKKVVRGVTLAELSHPVIFSANSAQTQQ